MIWPRFGLAIWNDTRAWTGDAVGVGAPTGFLWIHAVLIAASLAIGSTAGVLGVRGWRAAPRLSRKRQADGAEADDQRI
ncbi:hypothetical protein TPA0907_57640 [Micromonospora humidisoli]|nr:hypothetical protein TPA0907_57640 [Micromonospora sp. AKA109]